MSGYRRILLKLSGELLSGSGCPGTGPVGSGILDDVVEIHRRGVQAAIVVGGGNLLRGAVISGEGKMARATADAVGMLCTVVNALFLEGFLEQRGVDARVLSAVRVDPFVESYTRKRALDYLEEGRILILAGGTGNPYLTTDTAAALRAADIGAEVLLNATKVDGVYSADPHADPGAERFARLTFSDMLERRLGVMDAAAISICRDNRIPIIVFDGTQGSNLRFIIEGRDIGTVVGGENSNE